MGVSQLLGHVPGQPPLKSTPMSPVSATQYLDLDYYSMGCSVQRMVHGE